MAKKEIKGLHKDLALKALVTEKGTHQNALGHYAFRVPVTANKTMVAQAIWSVYGVKPAKVNIMKMKGKRILRGRLVSQRSDWKKAVVVLPKGQRIDPYQSAKKEEKKD